MEKDLNNETVARQRARTKLARALHLIEEAIDMLPDAGCDETDDLLYDRVDKLHSMIDQVSRLINGRPRTRRVL